MNIKRYSSVNSVWGHLVGQKSTTSGCHQFEFLLLAHHKHQASNKTATERVSALVLF